MTRPNRITPLTACLLGAGAAFGLAGWLALRVATAPVGLLSLLLRAGLLPSDLALAGALPDAVALALGRLLLLLALPCLVAGALSQLRR